MPGRPTRNSPGADPRAASQWRPRPRDSASQQPSSGTLTRGRASSYRRARPRPPRRTPNGGGTRRGHSHCQTPGSSRCGNCPRAPWPMLPKPSSRPSRSHNPPAWPCSAACRRGRLRYRGERRTGARARISPWSRARRYFTPRAWGPWSGSDHTRHGMQVDHCGRPATHAIAACVPPPSTGGPFLGPPPRPHKGSVEGHAEPPQGVDDEPGCTVPAGAGT